MQRLSVDVAVIGGGPAGSIAARILAENGLDTLLIERDLKHRKPCGGGIPSTAFREFLLPHDIVKKEVESIEIISPSQKRLSIDLKGGTISMVDRQEFDFRLREDARLKGARILEAEFVNFLESSSKIRALLRTGDGFIEVVSRYVIIADGVNSRARASLGLDPLKTVFTVSIKFNEIKNNKAEFWFGSQHAPRFYSWVFPLSAGTGCDESENIKDRFALFLKRRDLPCSKEEINTLRGYRIPLWSLRGFILQYNSSIFLTGDAAGLVMPLTFEGIYYAMASSRMAAEAIIEKRPSEYRKRWKARYLRRFSLMKLVWRFFLKNDRAVERLVDIHRMPEAQEIAMELWLRKSVDSKSLNSYIKLLRSFVPLNLLKV